MLTLQDMKHYKTGTLLVVSDWVIGKEHRAVLSKRIDTRWPYFVDVYSKSAGNWEHIRELGFWSAPEAVGYLWSSGYQKYYFHKHGPSIAYGFNSGGLKSKLIMV